MGKLSKKLVSIVTATIVISSLAFTSLPAIEAKAVTTVSTSSAVPYEDPMVAELKDQVESYSATNYGLTEKTKDGSILHAFCWSFNTIKDNMADIANAGYSTVQTSPANTINSAFPNMKILGNDRSGGTDGMWWWHYQPTDWKVGNYQLGTREEFKTMCAEADKYGVKIIVDVLPNHTTPSLGLVSQDLTNAAGGDLYHANGFKGIQNSGDWSWGNRLAATTGMMGGLPDVNTENKGFQAYYMKYVNEIIALGGDGFRYDTAKHIGVPSDPKDPKAQENDFWPVVTGKKSVNGVSLADNGNLFIYGEVLQGENVPEREYAEYMEMTASGYGGKLRSAVASKNFSVGNLSDWGHATPDKIVTWVESHDTYFNDGESRYLSDYSIKMCWAVIAARKQGTPLFMSRPEGNNNGSNWAGTNTIGAVGDNFYKDVEVAAANKFRNAMVGQPEYMRNPNGNSQILQIDRGTKGTCIINLGGDTSINNDTTMAAGTYTDTVTGGTFTVSGGKISGQLKGGKVHTIYNGQPVTKDPTVGSSAQTGSSFSSESLELTLSTTNSTSATYSVDGGSATTYTNGQKIQVGQNTPVGGTVKIVLNAIGTDNKTATATFTYTKKEKVAEKAGLYFTKPSGWGAPNVYVYDDSTATVKNNGIWPGVAMTDLGNGVYYYEVPASLAKAKVIFSSGANQFPVAQQPGHAYTTGKILRCNGSTWVEEDEVVVDKPLVAGTISTSATSPQVGYAPITISTSSATGGSGTYTYKIAVDSVTIGTSTSAIWTPTEGNHTITVTTTDAKGNTVTATKNFTVTAPSQDSLLTINSFGVNVASPQSAGTAITLSASATGGEGALLTQYAVFNGSMWTLIKGYSTAQTAVWTPTAAGTYRVDVNVKDQSGKVVTKSLTYVVRANGSELDVNSFSTNVASPQSAGTAITLSASATGGEGALLTQYAVFNGSMWTLIKGYSTAQTAVWTPTAAGTYRVDVNVKDQSGKVVTKSLTYVVRANGSAELDINSFSTNVASPQSAGTAITLSASATGGEGTLQTQYAVFNGSMWTLIKGYSTAQTAVWTPTAAGTYRVDVNVKDQSGKVVTKSLTYVVRANGSELDINSFSTNVASPQSAGTAITLSASATGGEGTLQTQYAVFNGSRWEMIKSFSTVQTAVWKPTVAGTYRVDVNVRDQSGKVVTKYLIYTVEAAEPITISNIVASKASPQAVGTSIKVTVNASSSIGQALTYKFSVYEGIAGWKALSNGFTSSKEATWIPSVASDALVMVEARDALGNRSFEFLDYSIIK